MVATMVNLPRTCCATGMTIPSWPVYMIGPQSIGERPESRGSSWVGNLAGAGGIEPPNGGIKIRCLTAWLRPIAAGPAP